MKRSTFLWCSGLALAMGLGWIACGGGGSSAPSSTGGSTGGTPPANHIWVGDGGSMAFNPPTLTVTAGTTLTWDFKAGSHNVTSGTAPTGDGAFTSGAPQTSGTYTHQFNTPGTFPYFCSVHGSMMTGTITVN